MDDDKLKKDAKKNVRDFIKRGYTYQLSENEMDEIAKRIGYLLLEDAIGFGKKLQRGKIKLVQTCRFAFKCQGGGVDYECPNIFGAFECNGKNSFSCGGKFKNDEFSCEGGWFDDFECITKFECGGAGGPFNCVGSFDDEDCETEFTCEKPAFDCDSKSKFGTTDIEPQNIEKPIES